MFWTLTLGDLDRAFWAHRKRREADGKNWGLRIARIAWLGAALERQPRLPTFERLINPVRARPVEGEEAARRQAEFEALVARRERHLRLVKAS